jgi:hypothetical protein
MSSWGGGGISLHQLVGFLSLATILYHQGFAIHFHCTFLVHCLILPLPLYSLSFNSPLTFGLHRGSYFFIYLFIH